MSPAALGGSGVLVDTNLLVLLVVGAINRKRIAVFKRTRQYAAADYDFLIRILGNVRTVHTVPHVLAEVSDLTDLPGPERELARNFLKQAISVWNEFEVPSADAVKDSLYPRLGLVDAAIATVARKQNLTVLTDDTELYQRLLRQGVSVFNFRHLRALAGRA